MPPKDSYLQTVNELFDLQKFAIKLGLDNISALSTYMSNPHLNYPVIHIAGTNGKGSTAFYIAQILQSCGLKVGLFTSPHLVDFRERIRVNDKLIEAQAVIQFWQKVKAEVLRLKATFFDTTTLMATHYFAEQKVDVAVFETGLGGRLDSTNIVRPDSVVITPIGFDHQQYLGKTLKKIAAEKAGIIKRGCSVYLSKMHKNALDTIIAKTDTSNAVVQLNHEFKTTLKSVNPDGIHFSIHNKKEKSDFLLPTIAEYQVQNFALAYLVCRDFCRRRNIDFEYTKIKDSIVSKSWPGRLQIISRNPAIIFDVSHNLSGIKKTLSSVLKYTEYSRRHLLLGIVNDKDVNGIARELSFKFKKIIVTEPDTYRRQKGEILVQAFGRYNEKAELIKDLKTAFEKAKQNLHEDDTLLALGSHYLIGSLITA